MKYIDADRLKAEIEKTYKSEIQPWLSGVSATSAIYDHVLPLINSLQQEQPIGEEYAIEIGKHTHTLRVGSQSDIDNLIRQEKQEQPEVDLEKEMTAYIERHFHIRYDETLEVGNDPLTTYDFEEIARHFAQWGAEHLKK